MEAEAIPIETRRLISRFGAAATVAGMLTPVVGSNSAPMPIAECNRLLIVYAAIEASYEAAAGDDGITS
jgi:hypothetical protein